MDMQILNFFASKSLPVINNNQTFCPNPLKVTDSDYLLSISALNRNCLAAERNLTIS